MPFSYSPTPDVLQWLSGGQLGSRLTRTVRWWFILQRLYGAEQPWAADLEMPFRYGDLRDRLFAPLHPQSNTLSSTEIKTQCPEPNCICQRTVGDWITPYLMTEATTWKQEIQQQTGRSPAEIEAFWRERPFAVVHRTLREDLTQLAAAGWLRSVGRGQFEYSRDTELPTPPEMMAIGTSRLERSQLWQLLRVLEDISFVQPNLSVMVNQLWEQAAQQERPSLHDTDPPRRIYIHLDYIFSDEVQDRVDGYQETIERLWQLSQGGVVQFEYGVVRLPNPEMRRVSVIVYPVCIQYARRAKYLSGYGIDPEGVLQWHNYRLDRIVSDQIQILPWGDGRIPLDLKELHRAGELPTWEEVQEKLDEAWGFNFYAERQLLIMRFSPEFARWYVNDTDRHPTFQPIAYARLPNLVRRWVRDGSADEVLGIINRRPSTDAYFWGWIRVPDIDVTMRLRDWRPNGEVIAPLGVRSQMRLEAEMELGHYKCSASPTG